MLFGCCFEKFSYCDIPYVFLLYSVAPTVLTPPTAMLQRYTMATTPVTSYQLPAGFMYQPQLMQQQQQLGAATVSTLLQKQQRRLP